jgi:hypothetical protein
MYFLLQSHPLRLLSMHLSLALCLHCLAASPLLAQLVPFGSDWKYFDQGTVPAGGWKTVGFNDLFWGQGPAQLGYGDGDEATVVSFGGDEANKHITTYFRHTFNVSNPSQWQRLDLDLLRDDGAVVYLNGQEILRSALPAGSINDQTLATAIQNGADEDLPVSALVDPALLVDGNNILAVEVHQSIKTSSDISFDLELRASASAFATVSRNPYLQMMAPTSVAVRWRTDLPTSSRLRFGRDLGQLDTVLTSSQPTTEHHFEVSGLSPKTRYYYAVGDSSGDLAGNDSNHFFETAAVAGDSAPFRFWALGDSGTAGTDATEVLNAYLAFTSDARSDFVLLLGDNAYESGNDAEYQETYFDVYTTVLNNTVAWPTIGNHDVLTSDVTEMTGPYFDNFEVPIQAEIGGEASGTEAYYSFDYGNAHFICLDSFTSASEPGSPMVQWLQADLAANTAQWVIAFFHHPPYSRGGHNSDSSTKSIMVRENLIPVLESSGVDLVLTGHSHVYERSRLLDQHYGDSTSLLEWMVLNDGDGRVDGDGAYQKPSVGQTPHEGAVFVVAGSAAVTSTNGTLDHPVMEVSLSELGSLVIDVDGSRLDAHFVSGDGIILDYFTLEKGNAILQDGFETGNLNRWSATFP